jgi:hypothetical protein
MTRYSLVAAAFSCLLALPAVAADHVVTQKNKNSIPAT